MLKDRQADENDDAPAGAPGDAPGDMPGDLPGDAPADAPADAAPKRPVSLLTDTLRAVAFLSRLRVPSRFFEGDDGRLTHVVRAFPLAGLLITLPAALLLFVALVLHAEPLLAGLLALTLQTLVTGALHEDGLADTADGLGGGRTRGHALDIMKDSRIGTYGVMALLATFALRAVALGDIAVLHASSGSTSPAAAALACLAVACLSRAGMVWHWSLLPPARDTGVAAGAGQPHQGAVTQALASGVVIAGLLLVVAGVSLLAALLAFLSFAAAVPLFTRTVRNRIAGHTGDTIGATQQITETVLLVALAVLA